MADTTAPAPAPSKPSDGNTSFLRAARAGHLDKVLEQLRNNVDINTCNANGLNALHLASKDGHVHVVTELLKRGANVDSATKKGNTALHIASLAGQEEVVRLLVEHGASVNVQSQNGFTPLYMAAQENHDNVVKYLLANGANQSLATEDGFTPLAVAMQQGHDKVVAVLLENDTRGKVRLPALHIAAKKDDCKAAALLLQNEHNPDVTSKSGFTPLHIASHYGNEGIANLLLNKGADVNYAAKHNITPLHVAAKWGKSNMVSLLLEKGANIESKTRDGLTPLHCAARSGHEQVVDMLLERGAPISSKTKNGLAPLHMASQGDHVDAARILLYHRAPVDEVTVDYLTALHVAAHCGHARVAKLLLDRKADPNARALNGFTPLHIACKKNRIKVVELLLKHGASIEATTESGLTPLHVASFMGCMNIVIYLLQNEANPDVPTVRGESPLHLAARANQTDIIRILLRNGAQVDARAREQQTPLHIAARLGNVDIVMLLLQHGAAVDCTTKDLYSALHIAAKEGQDEVAAVLLENGASVTATTKKGFTPLHLAAKYGNMKVARLLLQRDAPVDAQGKNGVTPLHVASHYDHQNVALLLLDKGASPHATAKNGHTPLHIAAKKNQMDIATTLLEYGAKANAESKAGFTPLHLSSQEGHVDMSSLLIDHHADTNHKAKNGLSPLHLCAQEDRVNVASILVKNGAEVDSTTKAGYTPLHVACHFGQLGMVRFLLDSAACADATTAVGYTPLHQAAQQGHCAIVNTLLEHGAPPNATTNQGQTAMSIAQKLGYISVVETLKGVTEPATITPLGEEKYKVVSPETMQETFMSDSEDEGGEDTLLSEQPYRYLTVDEMKSLGDDSLPIDVRQDERQDSNRECMSAVDDTISPQHLKEAYSQFTTPDNVDIARHPLHVGFLVSFLVDARGGAMRGCRHSGVRVIVPPRRASMPMRVTCRYLRRDKLTHPPPLMEGEALASRILELGPVGAKFLGPVMIEVPHFGSLRGKEREIVILRSDNGETWREHTVDCSEEAVQDVLCHSFDKEDLAQLDDSSRTTRILTTDFPHYFAVVTRVRQEVHAIGPEGGMVSSSVVPQVQAVFPQGALTKKIKVGLQAQPIPAELAAKLLGNRVAVSPIVTVEPRRRKFHKPITLTIPKPQAANKGMINQYSGDAPTLRLLCSITGGTTRAQWEDVTGSTPFTFVNDCVSFTTTVSARFWLMDCRNVGDATKMATELYREAIHVPFMAKFVVFAKRVDPLEARLRIFCMTDDKEDKTLEHQEHFTEVAKSRDVEVLEGKTQYVEFAGNLVPVTKSGEQLQLGFRAFRENRLPFTGRVKDPHADPVGRTLFMREARLPKGEPPQQPICVLNIVLPDEIIPEATLSEHELHKYSFIQDSRGLESYQRVDLRLSDISNLLGEDWVSLAHELGVSPSDINRLKTEHPQSSPQQGLAMLRLWLTQAGNKAQASTLESALQKIGRDDIVQQCVFNVDHSGVQLLKEESQDASIRRSIPYSHKDILKDSESVEEISRTQFRKKSDFAEKDDKEEKKYEAEEKEVEEVKKSVSERRKEIEKRLSLEKPLPLKTETTIEKINTEKIEDVSEKEIAEEKIVSSPEEEEPSELSFEQKRLSFEQGKRVIEMKPDKTTMKEVKERADERFLAEERKAAESLKEKKSLVDETSIPFDEKRKSFEKSEKENKVKEEKSKEKIEDARRDSALFEGVSQGLVRLDAAFTAAPQVQDLLSPKASKTPPPSPAEFKDLTGTVAWTEDTSSVIPTKIDQSHDWAERGQPDPTIDASNKEHPFVSLETSRQGNSEENITDCSIPANETHKFTETLNIETHDHSADKVRDKDKKYQFTMAVTSKEGFTEMSNTLMSFLENEKTYYNSNDLCNQTEVAVSVNTEVLSSDETEEYQSKIESEPKPEKTFVGKMSKKFFGVFKKDEKRKKSKNRDKTKINESEYKNKKVLTYVCQLPDDLSLSKETAGEVSAESVDSIKQGTETISHIVSETKTTQNDLNDKSVKDDRIDSLILGNKSPGQINDKSVQPFDTKTNKDCFNDEITVVNQIITKDVVSGTEYPTLNIEMCSNNEKSNSSEVCATVGQISPPVEKNEHLILSKVTEITHSRDISSDNIRNEADETYLKTVPLEENVSENLQNSPNENTDNVVHDLDTVTKHKHFQEVISHTVDKVDEISNINSTTNKLKPNIAVCMEQSLKDIEKVAIESIDNATNTLSDKTLLNTEGGLEKNCHVSGATASGVIALPSLMSVTMSKESALPNHTSIGCTLIEELKSTQAIRTQQDVCSGKNSTVMSVDGVSNINTGPNAAVLTDSSTVAPSQPVKTTNEKIKSFFGGLFGEPNGTENKSENVTTFNQNILKEKDDLTGVTLKENKKINNQFPIQENETTKKERANNILEFGVCKSKTTDARENTFNEPKSPASEVDAGSLQTNSRLMDHNLANVTSKNTLLTHDKPFTVAEDLSATDQKSKDELPDVITIENTDISENAEKGMPAKWFGLGDGCENLQQTNKESDSFKDKSFGISDENISGKSKTNRVPSVRSINAGSTTSQHYDKNFPGDAHKSTASNDEKLNSMLIDMLIEQECIEIPKEDVTNISKSQTDHSKLFEKYDSNVLEGLSELRTVNSFGKIESLISESDIKTIPERERISDKPYVTTPTMQRRKIGGSQRLSREERPTLREISHLSDYSSSDEESSYKYIVTEPNDQTSVRKVSFNVDSEDETCFKVSDSNSEPDIDVTEMTPSPIPILKEQTLLEDSAKSFEDKHSFTNDLKKTKKVEQRFERMASETLEADPEVKFTADKEFQRMVSQMSAEEVEACISQWDEGGMTPSEEQDSSNTATEGLDIEALPEAPLASTNPFSSQSSQQIEFEHGISTPSTIFWAFDTTPPSGVIQPSELDIPVKFKTIKGETGEEAGATPSPATTRETDEALLDLAAGLQDNKGSSAGVGPSNSK